MELVINIILFWVLDFFSPPDNIPLLLLACDTKQMFKGSSYAVRAVYIKAMIKVTIVFIEFVFTERSCLVLVQPLLSRFQE